MSSNRIVKHIDLLEIQYVEEDKYVLKLFQSDTGQILQNTIDVSPKFLNDLIEQIEKFIYHPQTMERRIQRIGSQIFQLLNQVTNTDKITVVEQLFKNSNPLNLYSENPGFKKIPLELTYNGTNYLSTVRILARQMTNLPQNIINPCSSGDTKILFLADPSGNLQAAYDEGIYLFKQLSELQQFKNRIDFISKSLELSEINDVFNKYEIIHFVGHGFFHSELGICLQLGQDQLLSSKDIHKIINRPPIFIFLNSCISGKYNPKYNHSLSEIFLMKGVGCVISSDLQIVDKDFSKALFPLYKEILSGNSIGNAYHKVIFDDFNNNNELWMYLRFFGNPIITLTKQDN